jgi:rod shape-determining protein MreB and related proteins
MKFFTEKFSNDIGIDLGTANTLIYVKGRGIVLSEPSVVAVKRGTKEIIAIGQEAKKMLGRTPEEIIAIRPLRDGVIADFEMTQKMIRYFIEKVTPRQIFKSKPRIAIGVPSCITEVEKRAVKEAADMAGAKEVFLILESMAAAIGANIPVDEPAGNMICDIGGGTTEISVISLGGMVVTNAIRVAGDEFDNAIIKYIKQQHNLVIGEATSEDVKIRDGNLYPNPKENKKVQIKGRGAITGLPKVLEIDATEIRKAIQEPINIIIEEIRKTLDQTPPELAADIVERGIVLSGGGALLNGLAKYISTQTGVPVIIAENPMLCVALGAGRFLEKM